MNCIKNFFYYCVNNIIYLIVYWLIFFNFSASITSKNFKACIPCLIYQFFLIILMILIKMNRMKKLKEKLKLVLYFLMTLGLPITFISTTEVINSHRNNLYDDILIQTDKIIFPFYDQGQIGLEIDKNSIINPTTINGKILNDYFEIIYISFYIWGYLSFFICCFDVMKEIKKENDLIRNEHSKKNNKKRLKFLNLEYFIICWCVTFCIIFFLNILIPGKSPRIHLSNHYQNKIEGFGFSNWWRNHIDRDDSSGTFPSGHCGETLAVAFGIYYSHKTLGKIVFFMTFLISLSTLINRYHYISDLIAGCLCCLIGYICANLYLYIKIKKN